MGRPYIYSVVPSWNGTNGNTVSTDGKPDTTLQTYDSRQCSGNGPRKQFHSKLAVGCVSGQVQHQQLYLPTFSQVGPTTESASYPTQSFNVIGNTQTVNGFDSSAGTSTISLAAVTPLRIHQSNLRKSSSAYVHCSKRYQRLDYSVPYKCRNTGSSRFPYGRWARNVRGSSLQVWSGRKQEPRWFLIFRHTTQILSNYNVTVSLGYNYTISAGFTFLDHLYAPTLLTHQHLQIRTLSQPRLSTSLESQSLTTRVR